MAAGAEGTRALPSPTFRAALSALGSAQKSGPGVPAYTRWVNRGLGRYAAAAAYRLGLSPNAVTFLSASFSAVAIWLLSAVRPNVSVGIAAAALLAFGYLLDSADGQVARLSGKGSLAGEWLDHVVDAIRTPAIHLGVMIGLWRQGTDHWILLVALLYCLVAGGQFISQVLAEQLAKGGPRPLQRGGLRQSWVLLPTDTGILCWIFLLWGLPGVFLVVYTALFAVNVVHTAVSMRRKYVKLKALQRVAA